MAAVRLPLSRSFAESEGRTNFRRKSPWPFESIQTSWQPSVPMVRAGRLGLMSCFGSGSSPKQDPSAELPPKLTPDPLKRLPLLGKPYLYSSSMTSVLICV